MLTWLRSRLNWIVGVGIALVTFVLGRYRKRAENAELVVKGMEAREDAEENASSKSDDDRKQWMRDNGYLRD